ncbi:type 1 fimbrial major subunit FimA [Aeromonas bestiarum]|uniref:type 1 fimbrial major subunit FimA n=1 Tax=Aeromonas bestiarum TaxID=105751 RepID=UPI003D198CE1
MKIKTQAIITMAALSLTSTAILAATAAPTPTVTVNGGAVHFRGEVVNAACAVDANSADQTVQLGQVRSAKLAAAGSTSSTVGFNIQLADCDTAVSTRASVAFFGTAVNTTNTTVLALQSSAAGGATNVGVQILDSKGTPQVLDGATFSAPVTLNNGTNIIPFLARYYATGAATAGTANADATFKVQYQ